MIFTLISRTSLFKIWGMSSDYFHFIRLLKQTVDTLIRRHVLWCLVCVCTHCLCPTRRTPGLYGLSEDHKMTFNCFTFLNWNSVINRLLGRWSCCCWHIVNGCSRCSWGFCVWPLIQCPFFFCNHLAEEERDGFFTLFGFLISCGCQYSETSSWCRGLVCYTFCLMSLYTLNYILKWF